MWEEVYNQLQGTINMGRINLGRDKGLGARLQGFSPPTFFFPEHVLIQVFTPPLRACLAKYLSRLKTYYYEASRHATTSAGF